MNDLDLDSVLRKPPEFHQCNDPQASFSFLLSPAFLLAYVAIFGALVYQFLLDIHLALFPNSHRVLCSMRSRIIASLDSYLTNQGRQPDGSNTDGENMWLNSAKGDAMRRLLAWDFSRFTSLFAIPENQRDINTLAKATRDDRPPGLGNWDNSCYQNSVIQGLASLRPIPNFLDGLATAHPNPGSSIRSSSSSAVITALKDIIDKLNDPFNGGRRFWTPAQLKSMSSWQQQDAQEYFSKILDEVDKEASRAARAGQDDLGLGRPKNLLPGRGRDSTATEEHVTDSDAKEETDQPEAETYNTEPAREARIVPGISARRDFRNPLEGLLAQRVGCMRCGWTEGLSLIPFICLTVPLGKGWLYDVRECLDEYAKLEPIEGVDCAKCTLLRSKENLERLLKESAPATRTSEQNGTEGPRIPEALRVSAETKLEAVNSALEDDDFSEATLANKCKIPSRSRVSTTKSRQAVIARSPKSLVIHVNRSVFDEFSGSQRKNYANVKFPSILDLGPWCLGSRPVKNPGEHETATEEWELDPSKSMLEGREDSSAAVPRYEIRAFITHYGRHENGHYICYRKDPHAKSALDGYEASEDLETKSQNRENVSKWWRISDDDVMQMTEDEVLDQGGVFMLFYDRIDEPVVLPGSTLAVPTDDALKVDEKMEDSSATTPPLIQSSLPLSMETGTGKDATEPAVAKQKVAPHSSPPPCQRSPSPSPPPSQGTPSPSLPTVPLPASPQRSSSFSHARLLNSTSSPITNPLLSKAPMRTDQHHNNHLPLASNVPRMCTATPGLATSTASGPASSSNTGASETRTQDSASGSYFVLAN
ncbi:MAG: hypothetical protein M1837_004853 [Sclerophora amabilis]|nr:MAG: hypothetical protein M1837_004853 [Sclerophora amabilis]